MCQTLTTMPQPVDLPCNLLLGAIGNAVEAHSCVDTDVSNNTTMSLYSIMIWYMYVDGEFVLQLKRYASG